MKSTAKTTALIAGALLIFAVLAIGYSTAKGYTVWFLKIPNAVITVNGTQTKGLLHQANNRGVNVFHSRRFR
jgi:hypothetical protein